MPSFCEKAAEDHPNVTSKLKTTAALFLKYAAVLVPIWGVLVAAVTLLPSHKLKAGLRPSAFIFRLLGRISTPLQRCKLIRVLTGLLPIQNFLRFMDLGYSSLEITQIETGVFIYLVLEGVCYYCYRIRVSVLIKHPPQRSNIDQRMMLRLADHFVADTTQEDIVKFILYAFYCLSDTETDPHRPTEDISDPTSIWHGHYKLSQKYQLDFPLLTKDDIALYLRENLGLEPWHVDCMITRIEQKIGTQFPECMYEGTQPPEGVQGDMKRLEPLKLPNWRDMDSTGPVLRRPLTPLVNKAKYTAPTFPLVPLTEHCPLVDWDDEARPQVDSTAPDNQSRVEAAAKKVAAPLSSKQSALADRAYVYGANALDPHYRPIFVCLLLHLLNMLATKLLLPCLGFVRYRTLRHDMRSVMCFYVLYPSTDCAFDGNAKRTQPLLLLHGFGFGVVPYVSFIFYIFRHFTSRLFKEDITIYRPIIIPEFRWLGLLPNGGITISWICKSIFNTVRKVYLDLLKNYRKIMIDGMIRVVTSSDLDSIKGAVCTSHGIREELPNPRPKLQWEHRAPHVQRDDVSTSHASSIYLPTMPEVVDELVSFVRFITNRMNAKVSKEGELQWVEDTHRRLIHRMFGKALIPSLLHRTQYETRSYRTFWMKASAKSADLRTPVVSPQRVPTEVFECSFGDAGFLNPASAPEEASLSRHDFLTRVRLLSEGECPTTPEAISPLVHPDATVSDILVELRQSIHSWFEPLKDDEGKGKEAAELVTPSVAVNLWDYCTQEESNEVLSFGFPKEPADLEPPLGFDLVAHSYGTAVASCVIKCYTNNIKQVCLLDPICWILQLTKKAQLCALSPWEVKLFDRSYSPQSLSYISRSSGNALYKKYGVNAVDLNGRPVDAPSIFFRWISVVAWLFGCIPTWFDWIVDRLLLYVYWYAVYRDFGTRWTTGRQMQGHEYIDEGVLGDLAVSGKLMVVIGMKDLIVSSHSVVQHLNKKSIDMRPRLIVNNDHHGICLVRRHVLSEMLNHIDGGLSDEVTDLRKHNDENEIINPIDGQPTQDETDLHNEKDCSILT
eukprot:GHVH01017469.1.p1 GENE.GHVH01017469.1~~GHVH01017469.1.p1  ORF type:complete len:1063 (+),score=135.67 GHVH01017469.1:210-3398(+)